MMTFRTILLFLLLGCGGFGCGPDVIKNPLARHAAEFVPVGDVMLLAHTKRSAPRPIRYASPVVPDSKIAWNVRALLHEAELGAVEVEVDRQVVRLTGRVSGGFAAEDAELVARRVHGVQDVENRLQF